jgi:hypothetical protein
MASETPDLEKYLEDIRTIRETMLRGENRLHVPAWFFLTMGGLIAAGTVLHAIAALAWELPLRASLLAIWLPIFLLAGVTEITAWVQKGREEGLPWLSRSFGRFLATIAGIMVAVTAISVAALFAGFSAGGVLLLLGACIFLGYAPYCPSISIWIGWILLAPGLALLIAGVTSTGATLGAAGLIVVGFLVAGIAEQRSRRGDG